MKVAPSRIWRCPVGTPVLSSSNSEFGTVEHVLQIPEEDVFDGIAVKTKHGLRFVDRDQITDITTTLVRSFSDRRGGRQPPGAPRVPWSCIPIPPVTKVRP